MTTKPCKACKRPIHFVKLKTGKWMPCDIEEKPFLPCARSEETAVLITRNGEVVNGKVIADKHHRGVRFGYAPHWSTCEFAPQFRRGVQHATLP